MRTNIILGDDLINEAFKYLGVKRPTLQKKAKTI